MFLVGFRKNPHPPGNTQRVGTVILKRSYSIDASSGVLTPLDDPVPIFIRDCQGNLVRNSDFEITEEDLLGTGLGSSTKPAFWIEDGIQADLVKVEDYTELIPVGNADFANKNQTHIVRLSESNSHGRLTLHQPISFNEPDGGSLFQFSLYVCAEENAQGENAQIEVEKIRVEAAEQEEGSAQHLICEIGGPVGSTFDRRVAADIRFPPELASKKVQITISLPIATDPDGNTVTTYYNMVQLEERDDVSEWDPEYILLCESDLVPYKPQSDIIVSGFTGVAGPCEVQVQVNGQPFLQRVCRADEKSLFGWEPRVNVDEDRRHAYLGDFRSPPKEYPPEWPVIHPAKDPLPADFDNRYFNGSFRDVLGTMPAYLPSDAQVGILRNNSLDYAFSLAGERFEAAYYVLTGPGAQDSEAHWQRRALALNLDTLVIEPDNDTCYAVWRGVWNFDAHADGDYRKLEIILL